MLYTPWITSYADVDAEGTRGPTAPLLLGYLSRCMIYAIIHLMKRTTIFIDEALERDLRAIAERERRTVSWVVREALGSYVARRKKDGPELSFVAVGRSGRRDTAERNEELLWRDPPSRRDRKRRGDSPPSATSSKTAVRKKD
jgi:hypothetical protein